MDLGKIGKFIAKKRVEKNYTQESLAEELDISNRSVSKWERGVCLPDANNMAKLCELFGITYNELLSGEEIKDSDYKKKAEESLKEFSRIETAQNKRFFMYENVIGVLSMTILLATCFALSVAYNYQAPVYILVIIGVIGFALALTGFGFCTKIETEAGKYKCAHCGHLYVPKYSSILMAMHMGRTRYMTCPKCGKKSWQKKVI